MEILPPRPGERRLHPAWWTAILLVVIIGTSLLTAGLFTGAVHRKIPVTLTSDRAGLMMEPGSKVKMRGVEVGKVAAVIGGNHPVSLKLELDPDQVSFIPANVGAQIRATTTFGAKYVDLIYPEEPSVRTLAAGAVLVSRNVSSEVNTVFENLVEVLDQIDPPKLNAVLSALAEGIGGKGHQIGEAITAANQTLLALHPRNEQIREGWRALEGFSNTYDGAAHNIIDSLDALSTTATTVSDRASTLEALLLNTLGLSREGIELLAPNAKNLVDAINTAQPTTALLLKYNPEYTCLLKGAKSYYDDAYKVIGGNGRTAILDATFLFGSDRYVYPDNLPIVAAKGGPGGKPGCGSLPDASKQFPVRALLTNTGWGRGLDYRPNPGIGHPFFANYFPVTRAVPEQPRYTGVGPPAPGPVPYPGAPPYGAPLYGPGGVPLWPGLPPAPADGTVATPAPGPPQSPPSTHSTP